MSACVNRFSRPSRANLDGDELCQECADAWARGEGQHAARLEAQEAEHADTSGANWRGPGIDQSNQPVLNGEQP